MEEDIGLNKEQIRKIIQRHLNENADLLIGIDDPEMNQLIDVLIKAFVESIAQNNSKISHQLRDVMRMFKSMNGRF